VVSARRGQGGGREGEKRGVRMDDHTIVGTLSSVHGYLPKERGVQSLVCLVGISFPAVSHI